MTWRADAELAGTLYRRAKPYTALLIARCVEPGEGQGARTDTLPNGKVTVEAFSAEAGIGGNTVRRYLRAWAALAAAGLVPAADQLTPGEDVELPEAKAWTYYYREANPTKPRARPQPKPDHVDPDIEGGVSLDGKRVPTALRMLHGVSTERLPEGARPHLERLTAALSDIAAGNNPNKAYVFACSAVAELAAYFERTAS